MDARLLDFEKLVEGTPFLLYGRTPGKGEIGKVGLDCCGLIVIYFQFLGIAVKDYNSYETQNQNRPLCETLLARDCERIEPENERDGDVLLFSKPGSFNAHFGIRIEPGVYLHTSPIARKVRRKKLDGEWPNLVVSIWRPRLPVGC